MKYILVETNTEVFIVSSETYEERENGYLMNNCIYPFNLGQGMELKQVAEIPEGVVPQKYCYNETNGFYLNPNYVEYISPEQEIINLKSQVEQLTLTLGDALLGGSL